MKVQWSPRQDLPCMYFSRENKARCRILYVYADLFTWLVYTTCSQTTGWSCQPLLAWEATWSILSWVTLLTLLSVNSIRTEGWNFSVKPKARMEKQACWDIYVLTISMAVNVLHPDTSWKLHNLELTLHLQIDHHFKWSNKAIEEIPWISWNRQYGLLSTLIWSKCVFLLGHLKMRAPSATGMALLVAGK